MSQSWWNWWNGNSSAKELDSSGKRCSIVLDMDECLIHLFEVSKSGYLRAIENDPKTVSYRHHFFQVYADLEKKSEASYGIMRPGLVDFLEYCFENFEYVVLWSAGTDYYVEQVSDFIFSQINQVPKEVLARSRCKVVVDKKTKEKTFTKPLQHLPYVSLERCFFVDDREDNGMFNVENHILIPEFEPECTAASIKKSLTDRCLYDLIEWFESPKVKNATDIRFLDKSKIFNKK